MSSIAEQKLLAEWDALCRDPRFDISRTKSNWPSTERLWCHLPRTTTQCFKFSWFSFWPSYFRTDSAVR